jgi:hypothetical protein
LTDKKEANTHQKFLASVKEWISQHEKHPDKTRLTSKDKLQHVQMELVTVASQGRRFRKPKRQLVSKKAWDEDVHGDWVASKVVKERIGQEDVEGIYVLVGQEGVYDLEEYDDARVEEQVKEHVDADDCFAAQRFANKKESLHAALAHASKARDQNMVVANPLPTLRSVLDLVRECGGQGLPVGEGNSDGVRPSEDNVVDKGNESSPMEDDSGDESDEVRFDPRVRIGSLFGSKLSASSASHAAAPTASGFPVPGKGKVATSPAVKHIHIKNTSGNTQVQAAPTAAATIAATMLDGRGNRLKQGMQESISTCARKLDSITFDETYASLTLSTEESKQFQVELGLKSKTIAAVRGSVKTAIARLRASTNAFLLDDEKKELEAIDEKGESLLNFMLLLRSSSPDPEELMKAIDLTLLMGKTVSPPYLVQSLRLCGLTAKAYGDYKNLCASFSWKGKLVKLNYMHTYSYIYAHLFTYIYIYIYIYI